MKAVPLLVLALAGCCTAPSVPECAGIRGTVKATGPLPKRKIIRGMAEPNFPAGEVLGDNLVVDANGGVRWAFVWVKSGLAGPAPASIPDPVVLEQKGLIYTPHVLGIRVGQALCVRNLDPSIHSPHTTTNAERAAFMSGAQMRQGEERILRFERTEPMQSIRCDVHPWMRAWIGVLDHPYFAVTDAAGNFEIPGLPPGTYTLGIWHEELEAKDQVIVVKGTVRADFELRKRAP